MHHAFLDTVSIRQHTVLVNLTLFFFFFLGKYDLVDLAFLLVLELSAVSVLFPIEYEWDVEFTLVIKHYLSCSTSAISENIPETLFISTYFFLFVFLP